MTKSDNIEKLSEITKIIIKEDLYYLELKNALDEFKSLLLTLSQLENELGNRDDIYLESGKAIGPEWAARCIDDIMRTKRFICGVHKAIEQIKKNKKTLPVTVLYAGTGPFATLILPLITLYKPSELQLVLLEINPLSIKILKQMIQAFNAEVYIKSLYQCDAAAFKVPSSKQIDILLSECMLHGLEKEPQVAITYNLLPQLKKDVILIPEQITLHMTLIDSHKQNKSHELDNSTTYLEFFKNSKAVFTLNKETVLKKINRDYDKEIKFQKIETLFSEKELEEYDHLAISTEIIIYKDEKLKMNESGLTIPLTLSYLNDNKKIKGVKTQYVLGKQPGLQTSFIH